MVLSGYSGFFHHLQIYWSIRCFSVENAHFPKRCKVSRATNCLFVILHGGWIEAGKGGRSTLSTKLYTDVPLECVAFFSFHIYDSVVNYPPQHINGGYFYAKIHDTLYFYRCMQRLHCQNNTIILIFYNLA